MRPHLLRGLIGATLFLAPATSFSQLVTNTTAAPANATSPPVAPVRAVVDEYYGNKIADPYRYMEDLKSGEVQGWMKAQDDYTRTVLARIPGREPLLKRIRELDDAAAARVYDIRRLPDERYFYQKRLATEEMGKIYTKSGINGSETLVADPVKLAASGTPAHVINYYNPSLDGSYVAYGESPGGSEDATIHIVDVRNGRESGETIDRGWWGYPNWLPDNRSFLHNRMQKMLPGMPATERELKSKVYLHVIGTDPEKDPAIFGYDVSPDVRMAPTDLPFAWYTPASPKYLFGLVNHGVQPEVTVYVSPLPAPGTAVVKWRKLFDVDAGVVNFDAHDDDLYLITHKDALRYKLVRTSISNPDLEHATVVVPESEAVVRNVVTTHDAIYVQTLDGGIGRVFRIPFPGSTEVQRELALPLKGQVWFDAGDARIDGILLGMTTWTKASSDYSYDPRTDRIAETTLVPHGPFDSPNDIVSEEVKVASYDGTMVPLSIVHRRDMKLDGSNPTLLEGYGAYGITLDPWFDPMLLAWFDRGGVLAVAHVRGGGEYGEGWHLAGKLLTKHNTWRDFIAAAQYLVDNKYTSPARLAGEGGSAGGITIGRAITERPDLFAAALDDVGISDALRVETSPNGPPNTPEFGTTSTREGYQALYEMSTYHHIKDGTPYPAVMVTTGINDPRVTPWEPAKLTARLQAATSSGRPVLLRVDYEAGHGWGSTKSQREKMAADQWSFLLWQFGVREFQPVHL